jgi:hypothetical protein
MSIVQPLAGLAVTVYVKLFLQTIYICCVMVPLMGTTGEEGSILLKEIPPILGPANEQGGATLMVYELFKICWGTLPSMRVMVKVKSPDCTGVPDISAVSDGDGDGVKNRPGGRLPAVMDQKYGVVPFDPVRVAEYGVLTWPLLPLRLGGDIFNGAAAKAELTVIAMMNKINIGMIYM